MLALGRQGGIELSRAGVGRAEEECKLPGRRADVGIVGGGGGGDYEQPFTP